jgi:hypothetical protein
LLDSSKNLIDVLLKTEFEHLISLVQDHSFDLTEVDVTTFDVVEHTAGRAYEKVHTLTQFSSLVIYRHSSIHCHSSKFIIMQLNFVQFS